MVFPAAGRLGLGFPLSSRFILLFRVSSLVQPEARVRVCCFLPFHFALPWFLLCSRDLIVLQSVLCWIVVFAAVI